MVAAVIVPTSIEAEGPLGALWLTIKTTHCSMGPRTVIDP